MKTKTDLQKVAKESANALNKATALLEKKDRIIIRQKIRIERLSKS